MKELVCAFGLWLEGGKAFILEIMGTVGEWNACLLAWRTDEQRTKIPGVISFVREW